jgi:hypothetical protein
MCVEHESVLAAQLHSSAIDQQCQLSYTLIHALRMIDLGRLFSACTLHVGLLLLSALAISVRECLTLKRFARRCPTDAMIKTAANVHLSSVYSDCV